MYIPTDEYLDEVKARREAATSGPWEIPKPVYGPNFMCNINGEVIRGATDDACCGKIHPNTVFIAHAPEDSKNLELGCRNLKAENAELREALVKIDTQIAELSTAPNRKDLEGRIRGIRRDIGVLRPRLAALQARGEGV